MRDTQPAADPSGMTIRLRPLISWLGGFLGLLVSAPGILGCVYWALHPTAAAHDPASPLFCLAQAVICGWPTYRWLTIRGSADEHSLYLRGWFKTLAVPTHRVAAVRQIVVETMNDSGTHRTPHDVLVDHAGKSLGRIPDALGMCPDWKPFLAHLRRLAAASREVGPAAAEPRPLEDIPVSEWTLEDVDRYERRG